MAEGVIAPTYWVSALRTLAFERADLKSPVRLALSMNSLVSAQELDGKFVRIAGPGWVFAGHLSSLTDCAEDPAGVAAQFAGAPYCVGGRESLGLDCSGLVQQAHYACAIGAARDTDISQNSARRSRRRTWRRDDLVFWRGHVGIMLDEAQTAARQRPSHGHAGRAAG